MSYLLETDKLTKIYGKQKAVNEVNVHLEKVLFTALSEETAQEKQHSSK
jgi:ABC-type branched-subunit amino acid transport system ATPase component